MPIKRVSKLHKENDTLRKQVEVAQKFIDDMIVNDGTHSDISILAERTKAEIERIEKEANNAPDK